MSETKYIAKPQLKKILSQQKYKDKYPTQKDFALAVGVKEPTISRFDNQTRYDINTLISVSKELDMPVEELFTIEENPNYVKVDIPKYEEPTRDNLIEFVGYLVRNNKILLSKDNNGNPTFELDDSLTDLEMEEISDRISYFDKHSPLKK